uniref:Uncharacterized protein MANES_05G101800 n=2 Tax=Rhizophora mucronata TaxID=61149 RepID=A0A2P2JL65_RHIMU
MGLQNTQNQNMNLVLSTDAKPRLKWTPELHQRFVEAVNQLGGADRATPKSLMRVMGIPGLTLYHLKSYLQKYRLGKIQLSQSSIDNKQEETKEIQSSEVHLGRGISNGNENPVNKNLWIAQALQMQLEVQRKLHQQIEVQRHLQLRIEAQGKYLQSILKKAQETLAGYNSSSVGIEFAKAELSQLVSMVNTGCPSSAISELTETGDSSLNKIEKKRIRSTVCSMESSLTSSESSGRKEDMQQKNEIGGTNKTNTTFVELALMEIPPAKEALHSNSCYQGKKRSGSTISDDICVEQPLVKRSKLVDRLEGAALPVTFDLNSQYPNDTESGSKAIDLNCKGD